jgi:pantoate--beta-alanine ligase
VRVIQQAAAIQRLSIKLARPVVLVPTMGALHAGHFALVDRGQQLAGSKGTLVATVFVNPTQFGPHEDYKRYPRRFGEDRAKLQDHGCRVLFAPSTEEMYYPDRSVLVTETRLASLMCGASRPGHFSGVCTVVAKLFNLISPDIAIFGQKDFQQFAILRRMVRDLNFPVRLIVHPIVRDADGLALSSRNEYLSVAERKAAPSIYRVLCEAEQRVKNGFRGVARLEKWMHDAIAVNPLAKVDYAVIVAPETLQRKTSLSPPMLLAAAVYFGSTRLIDNVLIGETV